MNIISNLRRITNNEAIKLKAYPIYGDKTVYYLKGQPLRRLLTSQPKSESFVSDLEKNWYLFYQFSK